jgi:hypothetical protein
MEDFEIQDGGGIFKKYQWAKSRIDSSKNVIQSALESTYYQEIVSCIINGDKKSKSGISTSGSSGYSHLSTLKKHGENVIDITKNPYTDYEKNIPNMIIYQLVKELYAEHQRMKMAGQNIDDSFQKQKALIAIISRLYILFFIVFFNNKEKAVAGLMNPIVEGSVTSKVVAAFSANTERSLSQLIQSLSTFPLLKVDVFTAAGAAAGAGTIKPEYSELIPNSVISNSNNFFNHELIFSIVSRNLYQKGEIFDFYAWFPYFAANRDYNKLMNFTTIITSKNKINRDLIKAFCVAIKYSNYGEIAARTAAQSTPLFKYTNSEIPLKAGAADLALANAIVPEVVNPFTLPGDNIPTAFPAAVAAAGVTDADYNATDVINEAYNGIDTEGLIKVALLLYNSAKPEPGNIQNKNRLEGLIAKHEAIPAMTQGVNRLIDETNQQLTVEAGNNIENIKKMTTAILHIFTENITVNKIYANAILLMNNIFQTAELYMYGMYGINNELIIPVYEKFSTFPKFLESVKDILGEERSQTLAANVTGSQLPTKLRALTDSIAAFTPIMALDKIQRFSSLIEDADIGAAGDVPTRDAGVPARDAEFVKVTFDTAMAAYDDLFDANAILEAANAAASPAAAPAAATNRILGAAAGVTQTYAAAVKHAKDSAAGAAADFAALKATYEAAYDAAAAAGVAAAAAAPAAPAAAPPVGLTAIRAAPIALRNALINAANPLFVSLFKDDTINVPIFTQAAADVVLPPIRNQLRLPLQTMDARAGAVHMKVINDLKNKLYMPAAAPAAAAGAAAAVASGLLAVPDDFITMKADYLNTLFEEVKKGVEELVTVVEKCVDDISNYNLVKIYKENKNPLLKPEVRILKFMYNPILKDIEAYLPTLKTQIRAVLDFSPLVAAAAAAAAPVTVASKIPDLAKSLPTFLDSKIAEIASLKEKYLALSEELSGGSQTDKKTRKQNNRSGKATKKNRKH